MDKFFASFVKVTGELGNILFFRTKRFYQDKKAQNRRIKGPAIVVSNHKSIYDFVLMMFTFFSRNLRCLVADVLYKKKFVGFMLKKFGSIKVNRNRHDLTFVDECQRILDKGGVIEVYPEARIPLKNENEPLPFTIGAAMIAYKSRAKIIPVYTEGRYFKFKRNYMIIGTPIDPNDIIDETLSQRENLERLNDAMRNKIIELKDELKKRKEKR